MHKLEKKQGIQRRILLIAELVATVKHFILTLNLHQGIWICDVVFFKFYLNQILYLLNETKKSKSFKHSISISDILIQNILMNILFYFFYSFIW